MLCKMRVLNRPDVYNYETMGIANGTWNEGIKGYKFCKANDDDEKSEETSKSVCV